MARRYAKSEFKQIADQLRSKPAYLIEERRPKKVPNLAKWFNDEQYDRRKRSYNVIGNNVEERGITYDEIRKNDENAIKNILNEIDMNDEITKIKHYRIRNSNDGIPRYLKIKFSSPYMARTFLRKIDSLRSRGKFGEFFNENAKFSFDLTPLQQVQKEMCHQEMINKNEYCGLRKYKMIYINGEYQLRENAQPWRQWITTDYVSNQKKFFKNNLRNTQTEMEIYQDEITGNNLLFL